MPWIIGGATLGAAGLGFLGATSANKAAAAQSDQALQASATAQAEAQAFNSKEAAIQRNWQHDMSASAYQRAITDMKSAGLNPMLAYSQGGANPGSGAAAAGTALASRPPAPVQNVWGAAAGTAAAGAEVANRLTQNDVLKAEVKLKEAQATQNISSAGQLDATRDATRQEMQSFEQRMKKLGHETVGEYYRSIEKKHQAGIASSEDLESARYYLARAQKLTADARVAQLAIPEALADAEFYSSAIGKQAPAVRFATETAARAAGAFWGIRGGIRGLIRR